MRNFLLNLKKFVFAERQIICVSNSGIHSKKIGFVFLMWNLLLVFWTSFATIKYFELREKVILKEDRITELNLDKQKLLSNLLLLEKNVDNIKNFILSLNKYDRFATIDKNELYKNNNNIVNNNLELVLDRVKGNMKNINLALVDRIKALENIKKDVNISNDITKVSFETNFNNDYTTKIHNGVLESIVLKKTLDKNLNYLDNLELFINSMPFSEPIESTHISSHFGSRLDPLIKTPREHQGLDLVGAYMAKVYSPAPGKVVFVGEKGGYGKTILIEHDHDFKTLYGHLNSFNVKVGDILKRGDIIGVQGSTGRSTGNHLHYEILRGNDRYNPVDFLRIGSNFY